MKGDREKCLRGRGLRLPRQAGEHRAAAVGAAHVAAPLRSPERGRSMRQHEPRGQRQHPAGRRPAGQAADLRGDPRRARREPDQGRARRARRSTSCSRPTSRSSWSTSACRSSTASSWPTMIRSTRASRQTAIILVSAVLLTDIDRLQGLRQRRGGLRAGAGRARDPARQGHGLRRAATARTRSSSASTGSSSAASPSAPRSCSPPWRVWRRARSASASPCRTRASPFSTRMPICATSGPTTRSSASPRRRCWAKPTASSSPPRRRLP